MSFRRTLFEISLAFFYSRFFLSFFFSLLLPLFHWDFNFCQIPPPLRRMVHEEWGPFNRVGHIVWTTWTTVCSHLVTYFTQNVVFMRWFSGSKIVIDLLWYVYAAVAVVVVVSFHLSGLVLLDVGVVRENAIEDVKDQIRNSYFLHVWRWANRNFRLFCEAVWNGCCLNWNVLKAIRGSFPSMKADLVGVITFTIRLF